MAAQDFPLTGAPQPLLIHHLLDRARAWNPRERIFYRDLKEFPYPVLCERIHRLANALTRLGVRGGDRVGVVDWDSHRYLELFFAVPMIGAVLHKINPRLSPEQLQFTMQHAEDAWLFLHADFLPLLGPILSRVTSLRSIVLLRDQSHALTTAVAFAGEYEALLESAACEFAAPALDENAVATLFYTTGTTGDPKGVFFTHRQIVLHTLANGLLLTACRRPFGVDEADVYMPLTPLFHVHGWGVPYIATLLGMRQIYPGRYEPLTLLQLLARHRVTLSHCVPTILQTLLQHPASRDIDLSHWKVVIGGSALTPALVKLAADRGVRVMGGYGMSETCPIVAASHIQPADAESATEVQREIVTRTGFPAPLVRMAVADAEGNHLPPGKTNVGELVLQAPWLTTGYFKDAAASETLWRGGWLHTGDGAYIDAQGYCRITDRLKDVVKVGGEWISSLELESALGRHEAVKEVAVIGVADKRWDEHPHAEVVLRDEFTGRVTPKDLAKFLHGFIDRGEVHKRAILTEITVVDALPRTSVGKIDKKAIRSRCAAAPTHGSRTATP
jgi:fatty-acyl-CoA synthase